MNRVRVPALAQWLLSLRLDPVDRPMVLGDLDEQFQQQVQKVGPVRARAWYWREALHLSWGLWWWAPGPATSMTTHQRWARQWTELVDDGRTAVRSASRTPRFTLSVIAIFALGMGVNLTVMSLIDRMLFRPLPYGQPSELVQLYNRRATVSEGQASFLSNVVVGAVRARANAFEDIAVVDGRQGPSGIAGMSRPLRLDLVSWNLLKVLRVTPIIGSDFTQGDVRPLENKVLLTDEAWHLHFNRSPDVFNRSFEPMLAGTRAFRIIGILPRGFLVPASVFHERSEGVMLDVKEDLSEDLANNLTRASAVARLKPGVNVDTAQQQVDSVIEHILPLLRDQRDESLRGTVKHVSQVLRERPVKVEALRSGLFFAYQSYAYLIGAAVLAVFLMACVNLGALFLVRGFSKGHEMAIRSALGARTVRVVRVGIFEAVLLCVLGTCAAVVVCYAVSGFVLGVVPVGLRGLAVSALDARLLTLAAIASIVAGAAAGGWPALRAVRANPITALRRDNPASSGRLRGASTLLSIEAALGVVLVSGAIIATQNLLTTVFQDQGYSSSGLYDLRTYHSPSTGSPTAADSATRAERIAAALMSMPEMEAVSSWSGYDFPIGREPLTADIVWRELGVSRGRVTGVGWSYFETLKTPVVAGREFTRFDITTASAVGVLNVLGVQSLWPGISAGDAIGRTVATPDGPVTVVGVTQNQRPVPGGDPVPELFVPFTNISRAPGVAGRDLRFVLRMRPESRPAPTALKSRLDAELGSSQRRIELTRVADDLDRHLQRPQFLALLFGSIGALALALAAVGLYALTSFDVSRRRREIGLRLSLGATPSEVRRAMVDRALRPVALGSAAGLLLAWWASSLLQSFVSVNAQSLPTFVVIAVSFGVVTWLAAWIPARTVSKEDPASVLRSL